MEIVSRLFTLIPQSTGVERHIMEKDLDGAIQQLLDTTPFGEIDELTGSPIVYQPYMGCPDSECVTVTVSLDYRLSILSRPGVS